MLATPLVSVVAPLAHFDFEGGELAHEPIGERDPSRHLEPTRFQGHDQCPHQLPLRHVPRVAVERDRLARGDRHRHGRMAGFAQQIDDGPAHSGRVDHQGGAGQLRCDSVDVSDDPGVRGPERQSLEMAKLEFACDRLDHCKRRRVPGLPDIDADHRSHQLPMKVRLLGGA